MPAPALDCRNESCAPGVSNVGDFLERIPEWIFNAHTDIASANVDVSSDNC